VGTICSEVCVELLPSPEVTVITFETVSSLEETLDVEPLQINKEKII
jgi:hypothetical protein